MAKNCSFVELHTNLQLRKDGEMTGVVVYGTPSVTGTLLNAILKGTILVAVDGSDVVIQQTIALAMDVSTTEMQRR
mgnify:CR=1 FL=1